MEMPWGKYKGKEIENLPSWYLKWLAENINEKNPVGAQVCKEADEEYQFREKNGSHIL